MLVCQLLVLGASQASVAVQAVVDCLVKVGRLECACRLDWLRVAQQQAGVRCAAGVAQ